MAEKSDRSSTIWATWLAAWLPEAMAIPQSASFRASTSPSVASGVRFEALMTKPALLLFTRRTMAASSSMDWEP